MQETRVWIWSGKISYATETKPVCQNALEPRNHNYWAHVQAAAEAHVS